MTNYATQQDIENNLKGVKFSISTSVTSDALADIIEQESIVIDQYISSRYTLPISDASALIFLKKICIDLVVYRVKNVLQPKTALPNPDDKFNQDIIDASPYRDAMKMLKLISDGKMYLGAESVKSIKMVSSTAVDEDIETQFDVSETQW